MLNNPEYSAGINIAQISVLLPTSIISFAANSNRSTPEQIDPLRTIDLLGLQNFFDHAGNLVNGSIGALAVITAGSLLEQNLTGEQKRPLLLAIAGASAAASVNVAYEAGVHIPPYAKKSDEAGFDSHDAAYGSAAGVLYAAVFCFAALRKRRALAKHN